MKRPAAQSIAVLSLGLAAALVSYALPVGPRAAGSDLPLAVTPATKPYEPPYESLPPSRPLPAEYRILFKRSMFAKRGAAANKEKEAPPAADVVGPELRNFSLRGVAAQEGAFVAFVEDSPKSSVMRLRKGDAVARGRVRQISFGGIEYEDGGRVTQVAIGCRLDGSPPDAPAESGGGEERKGARKSKPSADGPAAGEKPAGERKEKER